MLLHWCVAGEFRDIASLAVQKGAIELKGLVDGAVHTAVTLRSQGENSLDTPFTAVPGLPRKGPSPAGALDAAMSEISTLQGFLQVLVEEQVFVGLAAARVSLGRCIFFPGFRGYNCKNHCLPVADMRWVSWLSIQENSGTVLR